MKLSVPERLMLLNLLPKYDSRASMKIARVLKEELSFSEAEWKDFQLVQDGDEWGWNPESIATKDVHIGEKAMDLVMAAFGIADENKAVLDPHLDLWERFEEEKHV